MIICLKIKPSKYRSNILKVSSNDSSLEKLSSSYLRSTGMPFKLDIPTEKDNLVRVDGFQTTIQYFFSKKLFSKSVSISKIDKISLGLKSEMLKKYFIIPFLYNNLCTSHKSFYTLFYICRWNIAC